jgi:hypothetical protein
MLYPVRPSLRRQQQDIWQWYVHTLGLPACCWMDSQSQVLLCSALHATVLAPCTLRLCMLLVNACWHTRHRAAGWLYLLLLIKARPLLCACSAACEAGCANVTVARKGACEDGCVCDTSYAPVCGANNVTYSNGKCSICSTLASTDGSQARVMSPAPNHSLPYT